MVVLQRSSVTALQVAQLIHYGTEKTLHSLKAESRTPMMDISVDTFYL
ncbi:hypothetical protein SNOG_05068 [Parastagonospora nodorum SN15]|uniref:Uncharacterized protein n=1 Tax=Phaeosphaeria nodorum (strain SN15 / ATCC MYA-4574 / FGSC 10173) TaxID=321614 RepID=Q0UT46_PHANO|nr:hypothetical protein SNOG_05068 [Parastagonospora nodorum SN15]EAT87459.1 hypothetical protein SNOG_05068 [Parastagonospora nodorum SN15]